MIRAVAGHLSAYLNHMHHSEVLFKSSALEPILESSGIVTKVACGHSSVESVIHNWFIYGKGAISNDNIIIIIIIYLCVLGVHSWEWLSYLSTCLHHFPIAILRNTDIWIVINPFTLTAAKSGLKILEIFHLTKAFSWEHLKGKYRSEDKLQLSFKYFVNFCFIHKLFSKVWE